MVFIVYSQVGGEKLNNILNVPDYDYYFVMQSFLPVLNELGEVFVVNDPEQEVDAIYDMCCKRGEDCFFISFSTPNKSAMGLRCPTVCVVACEYDRIPDEVWDDDIRNDWRNVFAEHRSTITLSHHSAAAVRRAMGDSYPVEFIPVPVWDHFSNYRNSVSEFNGIKQHEFYIRGNVIDSREYIITLDSFELKDSFDGLNVQNWNGETLQLGFTLTDESSAIHGGFYRTEAWGVWSSTDRPWLLLPYRLRGLVHIKITACAYGHNVNKEIDITLGNETKKIILRDSFTETITFYLKNSVNKIRFSGLDLSPVINAADTRTMGIGLCSIEISGDPGRESVEDFQEVKNIARKIVFDGVIYTSVLNPADDRKNWPDMVKAFCLAFGDVEDATLVLNMTDCSLSSFLGELHLLFQIMGSFKCRIVVLHGNLETEEYEELISSTNFYVNSSWCEGLCIPLMEFMSCGIPAIAPDHTSLADYVDESRTMIVKSGVEPSIWPHDPRELFRTLKYRIDFESLINAYKHSYDIVRKQPDIYIEMSKSASSIMKEYASNDVVKMQLEKFFNNDRQLW